jgi:hypothetical protein
MGDEGNALVRQTAACRTGIASSTVRAEPVESARHIAAIRGLRLVRLLAAPFVAAGVAVAGALFLILLPLCGIASIAEELAREGWRFLRAVGRGLASSGPRHS